MDFQSNEDESGLVDNAGFLVSKIDDEQKRPPSTSSMPLTIGYDLSPFEPDFVKAESSEEETLTSSDTDHEKDSSDDTKKHEVDRLLHSDVSLQEQLERIEMYNTRLLDSDSESEDDDEDEGSLEEQNIDLLERNEDNFTDSSAYAGLCDEQEDDESSSDVVDSIDGLAPLAATIEQFTGQHNISKSEADAETSEGPHTEIIETQKDNNGIVESIPDTRGDAYAKSVPLLKPPPVDKMQAFLQLKGLIDTSKESVGPETRNLFEANFVTNDDNQEGDGPPSTINHHNDQAPDLTAFGFDTISDAFTPAGHFSNEVVQVHEHETDDDKEDLITFSRFSVGD